MLWHWDRCRRNYRSNFSLVLMPTYGKLWDSVIPRYRGFLQERGYIRRIHYEIVKTPILLLRYLYSGHEVHFHGADRPDLLVAVEYSHAWIDEPGDMKREVHDYVTERVRCRHAALNQRLYTGVPQGLTPYAEQFDF